ncbi:hypothetical protein A1Q1_01864 [Trichosporon asahii var. asahii CBS 2479]|uniref:Enoyl reductase (ER) domain-containing protein n=1 Tax=Trichosporon asahii var. asahii (strain ATCC 90039 / CBS 2479 / JCM 2466 / KCTC 7840 / NBRC 103889/ NCYC 2677 / UAMH 7654) TaxID=1186058 RepID=J4UD98_TRIAS|nr:hypothetical protein A1Q1_01864 [Trichosporon asahii var. asahii CBS 2479]EJT49070.1 hypothetical protein A1Q1_01864 [Trichosporon asahii var. asahii CBS 2479]
MSTPQHHIALPWVPTLPNAAHSARTHAWQYQFRGLPSTVLNETVVPTPMLPPPLPLAQAVGINEPWLLISVEYAGLNPGSIFQMTLVPPAMRQREAVPEMEFAGEVLDAWSPDANAAKAAKGAAGAEWMKKAPDAPPSPRPYPPSTAAEAKAAAMAARVNPAQADAEPLESIEPIDLSEAVNPPQRERAGSKSSSSSSSSSSSDEEGKDKSDQPDKKKDKKNKKGKAKHADKTDTASEWKRGDRVAGMLPADFCLPTGVGALQAIIAVPAKYCVRVPAHVDLKSASCVMLAGMTADAMLRQSGILDFDPAAHPLEPTTTTAAAHKNGTPASGKKTGTAELAQEEGGGGEETQPLLAESNLMNLVGEGNGSATRPVRVLLNAASGGIGHLLLQLLKTLGKPVHVTAITSAKNFDLVRNLGADEMVDYTIYPALASHLGDACAPFDFAFDCLGVQALYTGCGKYLAPHGVYESVGVRPPSFWVLDFVRAVIKMKANEYLPQSTWLGGTGRVYKGVSMMKPSRQDRQTVMDYLASGRIRVVVDSTWEWEHARAAYEHLGQGHAAGKVVVKVDPKAY